LAEEIRLIMDLLFADDAALTADCPVKLQKIVDVFVEVTDAYGQVKKTEVMWVGKLDPCVLQALIIHACSTPRFKNVIYLDI
jgi:hypothetical protein